MSVEWIEHKGKRILYSDHRGLDPNAVIETTEEAARMVKALPEPEKVYFLTDFEGAVVDTKAMAKIKELGQGVFEPRAAKTAIVGITGIRHILVSAYNRVTGAKNQKLFDNQEEALEWLSS